MDLSINNVNFGGKREVLHSLNRAALKAKEAEFARAASQGPRPINMTKEEFVNSSAMYAYLDSATYDDSFFKTINEAYNSEEIKRLKDTLKPRVLQHCTINPCLKFQEGLVSSLATNKVPLDLPLLRKFFKSISSPKEI